MSFRIRVRNFQSIEDATIEVAGLTVITGPNNSGKALKNGTRVATPKGWQPVESLLPGDRVISGDGTPTTVLGVYPQGERQTWRVVFDDGRSVVVDGGHLWSTSIASDRFSSLRKSGEGIQRWKTLTTNQILQRVGNSPKGQMRPSIPGAGPTQYDPQEIRLDPYLLGVLLGDGSMSGGYIGFSSADSEIVDAVAGAIPQGYRLVPSGGYDYKISGARGVRHAGSNTVTNECRKLGITVTSAYKFIPESYKYNAVSVRLAVLQGLLDTDGTVDKSNGGVTFSTASSRLADDVIELVQSLGGKVRRRLRHPHYKYLGERREGLPSHSLCIRLLGFDLFRLTRKLALVHAPKRRNDPLIVSITSEGVADCTCIEVDHPSHLYQIEGHLVTHNTSLCRATYGAFTNARGNKYVRHGKESCEVRLDFPDGRSLVWEKGAKVNRYELDGKALNKVGQGAPPEVASLGVQPVEAAGRELWPQFAHQFVGQVFLLDEPGSVLAEAISDVARVGVLNEALRNSQSDRRTAGSELKLRVEDVGKHEVAVRKFDGLDGVLALVHEVEAEREHISQLRLRLSGVERLRDRLRAAEDEVARLAPVRDMGSDLEDAPLTKTVKADAALDWVRSAIRRLAFAVSAHDEARHYFEATGKTTFPSLDVGDSVGQLGVVSTLLSTLSSRGKSVSLLSAEVSTVATDLSVSQSDLSELLATAGACPTCGSETHHEDHVPVG